MHLDPSQPGDLLLHTASVWAPLATLGTLALAWLRDHLKGS